MLPGRKDGGGGENPFGGGKTPINTVHVNQGALVIPAGQTQIGSPTKPTVDRRATRNKIPNGDIQAHSAQNKKVKNRENASTSPRAGGTSVISHCWWRNVLQLNSWSSGG